MGLRTEASDARYHGLVGNIRWDEDQAAICAKDNEGLWVNRYPVIVSGPIEGKNNKEGEKENGTESKKD